MLCLAHLRSEDFSGLGAAAYTRVTGRVDGLTIALFNYAAELHGVQIGLLNYAGNNPRGLRWLPLANAHLD